MSDSEFVGYAGSLALGGLVLLIVAVLGSGQGWILRAADVLAGLAFLGYAGYLMVVAPSSPYVSWFVLVTPVLGIVLAVAARRRAKARLKRLEEEHSPSPYAGHAVTGHAERQPFPSPPPPLDPSPPERARSQPSTEAEPAGKMPSGLPSGPGFRAAPARPKRPSGLPRAPAGHDDGPDGKPD